VYLDVAAGSAAPFIMSSTIGLNASSQGSWPARWCPLFEDDEGFLARDVAGMRASVGRRQANSKGRFRPGPHIILAHARSQLDQHQAVRFHVEDAEVGDDPLDGAEAGDRQ
jgi:hypothetical protein